ncbi:MAG TPA: MFS transporter [Candidatus Nanopelagicales bacterium]|nr:MFS transporter [Candidatus Nanopelagicales bacterium]
MSDDVVAEAPRVSVREALNPRITRVLVGLGFSALGNGLVMALFVVYLHQVRGFDLRTAGLILTFQALFGLAVSPLVGSIVDRIGPQPVLAVGCLVMAVATAAFGFVTTVPQAIGVAAIMAVGNGAMWPPQAALLTRLSQPEHRQRVFGLQFMMLNLGLGLGGLVAAAILDVHRAGTFEAMYLIDAATFLIYFAAVVTLRGVAGPEERPHDDEGPGGYREVVGDRRMRRYVIGALVLMTCGYGSMDAGLPAFMTTVAHLPVNAIGVVFFLNTLVIVLGQVFVLHRIEGRSRSRLLAVVAVIWGSFWVVVAVSASLPPLTAGIAIALGFAVFAIGEMILSPVGPSLVNAFSPPHLRGRYNAVAGLIWGVSGALGPAIAGIGIGGGWGVLWALSLTAGCVVAAFVLSSLRSLITADEDGRPAGPVLAGSEVRG